MSVNKVFCLQIRNFETIGSKLVLELLFADVRNHLREVSKILCFQLNKEENYDKSRQLYLKKISLKSWKKASVGAKARPKYKDGTTANSKYITGAFAEYDLSKESFQLPLFVLSLSNLLSKKCFDLSRPDKQPRCP